MKIALMILGVLVLLAVTAMVVFVYVVQNVEQPAYRLVEQDGAIEVRDYPESIVAQVQRSGPRKEALRGGFGPLAGYIFAKERAGERISMTAPVVQQRLNPDAVPDAVPSDGALAMTVPVTQSRLADGDWAVRFIMPARYRLDQLPAPAGGDVQLIAVPARRTAAIRFSGAADDALIAQQESALRAWMQARGLTPAAPPVFAYYNDPFTPGPLRRNEVLIDLSDSPATGAGQ
jgi:hypothetical protein